MARSQVLNFADNFKAAITTAAWRSKPSWMVVAGGGQTITPTSNAGTPCEPTATRSKCGRQPLGHVSRQKEVAAVIEDAAAHVH